MSRTASSSACDRAAVVESRRLWRHALTLGLAALISTIALTGTSASFLGAVALAGAGPAAFAFNFHIPAALVRLFALSRTVAKYGERVVGHKAALHDQVVRRARLFLAMAASPDALRAGWQLARQDLLADYIDDVEDTDYARLRSSMPGFALAVGLTILSVLTIVVAPLALLPIAIIVVVGVIIGCLRLPRLRYQWRSARLMRAATASRFGRVFAAAVPLRAEGFWAAGLGSAFAKLQRSAENERGFEDGLALVGAVSGAAGPIAALAVLLAGWHAGLQGRDLLPAAFVAFGWLALGESAAGLPRMIVGRIRQEAAGERLAAWQGERHVPIPAVRNVFVVDSLSLGNLERTSPDGRPIGDPISLECKRGETVVLRGPSGCGKTTLLKQIAGWMPVDQTDAVKVDGKSASSCLLTFLGLHDATVLADTVRENLFAPAATDAECWEALEAVELAPRIRRAGGLDAWITQDRLSLGEAQRVNLARAWLTNAPIVLLDEPTEHVGDAQGRRILERLEGRLRDRILVIAAHDGEVWSEHARRIRVDLGG